MGFVSSSGRIQEVSRMRWFLISALTAAASFSQVPGSQVPGPTVGVPVTDEPPGGSRPAQPPPLSPPVKTSLTINGQKVTVKYSAPSMRKRVIFGGIEPYYKVWRAGANDATILQSSADLEVKGLLVPKGEYSLFVWLDPQQWQLIINRQTGQTGLEYRQDRDLGRVPMDMSRPPRPIERYRITLTKTADTKGQLKLAWENTIAAVDFVVRGPL
jgi:Protein of unknown function (DUF2911)